jgi:tRNA-specific 2-thiouridylase
MAHVFVGMSGGVDSSLTAALLVEQGYQVTGVYMKNWTQDLPGMKCPWAEDLADAKRVAVQLGIDFRVFDFENEYRHKVVDYMIAEYKAGRTPNPDIMCNQEVKFKLFLETALEHGADMIATGHYARTKDGELLRAKDESKDQTYFLYRVDAEALRRTVFPLGDYLKSEVRDMAKERGLYTATKKESMGICFVGKVGIRDFLSQFVETVAGPIVDTVTGMTVGYHDGAIFYTIGQRYGLDARGSCRK